MIFWTIVRVAFKSLLANKLRSILAMLGIIIAVWSVISALALGAGAQASVLKQLSSLGTNLLVVTPGERGRGGVSVGQQQNLRPADALAILNLQGVSHVAPVVRGGGQAKYLNKNTQTTLLGTTVTYFTIRDFTVEFGRSLTDGDTAANARVAVVGSAVATKLFGEDYSWCVGESIQLKGVNYRVIGVTASKGDQGWFNPDNQIVIPYTTAMTQVLGTTALQEIDIRAKDPADLDAIQERIRTLLRKRHRLTDEQRDDFNVHNQAAVLSTASTILNVMTLLLGGIAGISLLVGGIGIMNIMLVTVAERTREIGIRKAIGAREADILRQFLIESMVMSGCGGALGLSLGYATSKIVTAVQDKFTLLVTPTSVLLALGFSISVGVFFGYYPARRAAKLDPIEALRYE